MDDSLDPDWVPRDTGEDDARDNRDEANRCLSLMRHRDREVVEWWMRGERYEDIGGRLGFSKQRAKQLSTRGIETAQQRMRAA